ncbi:MAG: glycosyltransferase [Bryobacteraceae bacterium]
MQSRILHVIDSLGNGGLENGVVNLVRHMDRLRFQHCICTVRALGVNLNSVRASGARVMHIGKEEKRFQTSALIKAIHELRPDIIHTRNWGAIEGILAARLTGFGATVHSEHGLESGAASLPRRKIWFRRLAFEFADRVLCVSHQLRDYYSRTTGFRACRMTVIHNGVDSDRFCPDPAARARIRRELNIGENEFCVGCVGNLLPVKDHDTLLRALAILGGESKGWRVLIAGDGPTRPKLEFAARAVERLGLQTSFLGTWSRIPELLNAFDVYVLPSLNEGVSNSLLEAMATGLPVIATDVGGTPEVINDGRSGLLFPAGDSEKLANYLMQLRISSCLREDLGSEARRHAREHFSIQTMVRRYEDLYEGLAARALPAPAVVEA